MKFSIRDLFLVTMIVALVLGWWVDRSRLAAEVERQKERESWAEAKRAFQIAIQRESRASIHLPNSSAPAPIPPKI